MNLALDPKRASLAPRGTGLRRAFVLCALLAATGCVKSSTHKRTLAELAASQAQTDRTREELAQTSARLEQELARVTAEKERTARALADAEARVRQLENEALALENDRNRLMTQISQGNAAAELLRNQIERLSQLEREVSERNRIYQEVIERFRSLIAGGQLSVSITRGRLAINLPQDILFASGSATLGRDGRSTLTEVAKVLSEIPDRQFQVEGHTDDKPIQTAQFPSNWELSAARAIAVVHLLQDEGVEPENVSGAAFGEHRPIASNADDAGRRLNRRIEIVMVPNLDVIAGVAPDR